MNNTVTYDEYLKMNKWYYSPYFAIFLAFWWPVYFIPLIVAIYLQYKRAKTIKKLFVFYSNVLGNEQAVVDVIDYSARLNYLKEQVTKLEADYKNKEDELSKKYDEKDSELKRLLESDIKSLKSELETLKSSKEDIIEEIDALNSKAISANFDLYDFDEITSEEFKNQLSISKINEEKDLKEGNLVSNSLRINDKKFVSNNTKQIVRLFNAECDSVMSKATVKNIDSSRNKITRSFNSLNKIFETDGVQLKDHWLKIKLDQLNTLYLYEMKKNQEKEIQRSIREQMIEEEKVRREIEHQKQKLEKDQKQFNNEVTRMMKYLQKTTNDAEKQLYLDKINELEEKIKELEAEKEKVLERELNAKAGFVYIISNIGSFGEDVYKIGMTRRLEPMDRIKELSSASVPFEFDVHAMIFSDNAPELENTLHQTFKDKSVNKINYRKEFFRVSLDEIEKVVKQNYDKTVDFIRVPMASEYRQTLELENRVD